MVVLSLKGLFKKFGKLPVVDLVMETFRSYCDWQAIVDFTEEQLKEQYPPGPSALNGCLGFGFLDTSYV